MYEDFWWRMTPGTDRSPERTASTIVPIILALLVVIGIWSKIDMTPATYEEYKPLYEHLEAIQGKPEEFFIQEGKITISEDTISYEIENEECKVKGKYNRSFELLDTLQTDKSTNLFEAILGCVLLAVLVFCVGVVCTYIVIGIVEFIIITIIVLSKKFIDMIRYS